MYRCDLEERAEGVGQVCVVAVQGVEGYLVSGQARLGHVGGGHARRVTRRDVTAALRQALLSFAELLVVAVVQRDHLVVLHLSERQTFFRQLYPLTDDSGNQ